MQPFELRSLPDEKKRRRVFLSQLPYKSSVVAAVNEPVTMARIEGSALEASQTLLEDILGDASRLPEFLDKGGIIPVSEGDALRVGIASIGISNLRSADKMNVVIEKVRELDERDVAYWFEKLTKDSSTTAAGAFRFFLTGEA